MLVEMQVPPTAATYLARRLSTSSSSNYEPVSSNPALLIRQIRDELVELVHDTHLGRILFKLGEGRYSNIGYFALRQPAGTSSGGTT